ncbi:CPBP family glutamic-type intramembrane protease [Legionella sp. km772]|uniref:CPBP family glutamic-type intramembrane protease n=1 Tax=Legionella sp. km772 TaxID=2498111 RepID=UPI000F8C451F|nr:CPBP family glutamic-type intramembrane protease [Legionella sp. km772]RUR13580.1 CPBP family intramembrane metalloprotease [Legionella sp. km772]
MVINWPLVVVLFCLSIPGVFIAMTRLVYFLLPDNTEPVKKKASRMVIFQALFTVLAMSFAGTVLSVRTGLSDPVLVPLLQGKEVLNTFLGSLLPTFMYALVCFLVFCILYYGIVRSILDEKSLAIMAKLRVALKPDGLLLYGGVVEEIIARWGLMNLVTFFALLFTKQMNDGVVYASIIISGLLFVIGQIPIYIAAGCNSYRRLIYSLVLLSLCQSIFFGLVFWLYGLLAAIMAHVLFHLFWCIYERK